LPTKLENEADQHREAKDGVHAPGEAFKHPGRAPTTSGHPKRRNERQGQDTSGEGEQGPILPGWIRREATGQDEAAGRKPDDDGECGSVVDSAAQAGRYSSGTRRVSMPGILREETVNDESRSDDGPRDGVRDSMSSPRQQPSPPN
jgi:hypothetical protein